MKCCLCLDISYYSFRNKVEYVVRDYLCATTNRLMQFKCNHKYGTLRFCDNAQICIPFTSFAVFHPKCIWLSVLNVLLHINNLSNDISFLNSFNCEIYNYDIFSGIKMAISTISRRNIVGQGKIIYYFLITIMLQNWRLLSMRKMPFND